MEAGFKITKGEKQVLLNFFPSRMTLIYGLQALLVVCVRGKKVHSQGYLSMPDCSSVALKAFSGEAPSQGFLW